MTWEILGLLALAGLLIGVPLWLRARPKKEISWPPVSRTRGSGSAISRSAAQSGAWLSAGGIDNSGHDGGGGSSTGNGN
jgi:hypothetical protein